MAGLLILVCAAAPAHGGITVERSDAVVTVKSFDRHHPPQDMPKLTGDEAAVTVSNFAAEAHVGGEIVSDAGASGSSAVVIKVDTVDLTTKLEIIVWLPGDANTKLRKHEDAHRQIAEHYYEQAETFARRDADALLGQSVKGNGKDRDSAGGAALQAAAHALGMLYLKQIDAPCAAAQDAFDRITAHGTNAVPEAKAIQQAIAETEKAKN